MNKKQNIIDILKIQQTKRIELKRKPDLTYDLERILSKLNVEIYAQ